MSRTGLGSRLLVVCLSLLISSPILVPPKAEATPPGQDIRYTYDEAGRLTSVRDAAADTARYRYDPTGNTTSIARGPSSATTIVEFSPNRGPAGTSVTIFGTGFGATPGDNTVTFNGASATVQSASATELVVTVPGSATTGPIQVTAPGGSSTSDDPFTVAPDPAPTLATVSPTNAAAGDLITVTGTNLASTADAAVNQLRATVESASGRARRSASRPQPDRDGSGWLPPTAG